MIASSPQKLLQDGLAAWQIQDLAELAAAVDVRPELSAWLCGDFGVPTALVAKVWTTVVAPIKGCLPVQTVSLAAAAAEVGAAAAAKTAALAAAVSRLTGAVATGISVEPRPEMDIGKWCEEAGAPDSIEDGFLAKQIDTLGELAEMVASAQPPGRAAHLEAMLKPYGATPQVLPHSSASQRRRRCGAMLR